MVAVEPSKRERGGEEEESGHGYQHPGHNAQTEARGRHARGIFAMTCPKLLRYIVTRSVAEKERHSLNNRHGRKRHAHSGSCLCIDFAHKIGVGHIVKARHKHAHYSGGTHRKNNAPHRSLSEISVIVRPLVHSKHKNTHFPPTGRIKTANFNASLLS